MIVIGAGRVGEALRRAAARRGLGCTLVTRTEGWSCLEQGQGEPVLVAVRNHDLEGVIKRVPEARHQDLVFLQNGLFDGLLASHGLTGCSRGLLYFAVPAWGDDVQGGQTSWFTGPHAQRVVDWLGQLEIEAAEVSPAAFARHELEKVCWLVAHGLLCAVHDIRVGQVERAHRGTLEALVQELVSVAEAARGGEFSAEEIVDGLCAYSRTIPSFRASVKEWDWRDGWFVHAALQHGVPTPTHHSLLKRAGQGDRLARAGS